MALSFTVLDESRHDRKGFSCGLVALDDYLHHRAGQHQRDGIATTHVLTAADKPAQILAYCSLSAAQLHVDDILADARQNWPLYPVPTIRLSRLAVSQNEQGRGYGKLLLGHVVKRALSLRQSMGVRALTADARDAQAATFYEGFGFRFTARAAATLYLPI